MEECVPGLAVVYRPFPGGPAEDGIVVEQRPPYVMVRYWESAGGRTKATRPEDLERRYPRGDDPPEKPRRPTRGGGVGGRTPAKQRERT